LRARDGDGQGGDGSDGDVSNRTCADDDEHQFQEDLASATAKSKVVVVCLPV
jgi:hypothetical protein